MLIDRGVVFCIKKMLSSFFDTFQYRNHGYCENHKQYGVELKNDGRGFNNGKMLGY